MDNLDLLNEQLSEDIAKLKDFEAGSDIKQKEVRNIETLYRLKIEEQKLENEAEQKAQQIAQANRSDNIKAITKVGEIGIPILAYGFFYKQGLIFEQDASVTSFTVKKLLNAGPFRFFK